jgi:hypothetical protein
MQDNRGKSSNEMKKSLAADQLTKKQTKSKIISMDLIEEEVKKESNIGKKLSDFTMRKVIICVLLLVFSDPLFRIDTYITN